MDLKEQNFPSACTSPGAHRCTLEPTLPPDDANCRSRVQALHCLLDQTRFSQGTSVLISDIFQIKAGASLFLPENLSLLLFLQYSLPRAIAAVLHLDLNCRNGWKLFC